MKEMKIEVGDYVRFKVRAHPTMGEPYEVFGRVESGEKGYYAGNRYLHHAVDKIELLKVFAEGRV